MTIRIGSSPPAGTGARWRLPASSCSRRAVRSDREQRRPDDIILREASASATPQLFTIPRGSDVARPGGHGEPTTLTRTLRLTGAVAYNAFNTTPVITQVGGPVTRILVVPGEHVTAGQPMLEVSSPDYSQLLDAYLKAADSSRLAEKNYARAQDLYQHHAIAAARSGAGGIGSQSGAGGSERRRARNEDSRDQESRASLANGSVVGADSGAGSHRRRSGGASGLAGPGGAGGPDAGLYHLRSEHGLGSRQCVSGGPGICSQRRGCRCANRRISQAAFMEGFRMSRLRWIQTPEPCRRASWSIIPGEKLKRDMYCTVTVTAGNACECDCRAQRSGAAR